MQNGLLVYLQVNYSPVLTDNSLCRVLVSNCKDIDWTSRGRSVIVSSGATDMLQIRGR